MKKLKAMLAVAGCVAALGLMSTGNVQAQQRDPAQFRQDALDRMKDRLEVKDDAEWKLIEGALGKVMDAQRDVMAGRMRGMFGGGQRRQRGGGAGGDTASTDNGGQQRQRGGFFGTPPAEFEDLQKAIDDKAPADEIKAKLAKLREYNASKEAALTKAQDELKALLTSRQEAICVLAGMLK